MIKLKSLLNEYLIDNLSYLKRYLTMTDDEKIINCLYNDPHFISDYIDKKNPNIEKFITAVVKKLDEDKITPKNVINLFKSKFPEEYLRFSTWVFNNIHNLDPVPSWSVMSYEGILRNQWLIHFSDNAVDIWKEQKFSYGISDFDELAYSTSYTKEHKKYGGFNFAYDIKDYVKYGRSSYSGGKWKYGKEAVLFTASGIKAWHYGDEEPQVIFQGNTAKNIVHIEYYEDWRVTNSNTGRVIYRAQTLPEVVNWVISNFNQYKNVLLP